MVSNDTGHPPAAPERGRAMSGFVETQLQLLAELAELWPQCFSVYERRRRPLKIGINADLLGYGYSREAIGPALRFYVGAPGYLFALKAGADRVDLDGNVVGKVTDDEAAHAKEQLAKRRERLEARRQQQEAAARKAEEATKPKRLSLSDLRAAAAARKAVAA
jgi:ProP effector